MKYLDSQIFSPPKLIGGEPIQIANFSHVFLGVYHGAVRTVDREAAGVLQYSLPELRSEIAKNPGNFTADLRELLEKYSAEIEDFVGVISGKK